MILYQPEPALLTNSRSELDKTDDAFTGTASGSGVNPSGGVVLYYHLPELPKGAVLTMEIKDESGKLVRSYSAQKDSLFKKWDGGPSEDPVLTANKGLNRMVWDMRYPTMVGVPNAYYEASFKGHKASPGKYTITLKAGAMQASTTAETLANPLYGKGLSEYKSYHEVMLDMETELTRMHRMVNTLQAKKEQLSELLAALPAEERFQSVKKEGEQLVKKMTTWDEEMVQRKSKAYDDVENFPNKFTAQYIFLINQTESDIPMVTQPSLDRKKELDAEWAKLRARGAEMLEKDIPALNQKLFALGVGGVWKG
jgi:hypothetical protein